MYNEKQHKMNARIIQLQQVMSSPGTLANFNQADKLSGSDNYYEWLRVLSVKLRSSSTGVYQYCMHGDVGVLVEENEDDKAKLVESLNCLIRFILVNSVTGNALRTASEFTGSGRDLFIQLQKLYGQITILGAIDLLCEHYEQPWKTAEGSLLANCMSAFNKLHNRVYRHFTKDAYFVLQQLAALKLAGIPENKIKDIVDDYNRKYSDSFEDFTVKNIEPFLFAHIKDTVKPKEITANAFVAERVVKCYNCQKPGHISRNCPELSRKFP